MIEPTIIIGGDPGRHNRDSTSVERVQRGRRYRDLSTVCVIPAVGGIEPRVVESWWELMAPMNQSFQRVFVTGLEVADAYNHAIETILEHPVLRRTKYLLTLEQDNLPPPRGLIKLCESIDGFAAVGGLYWCKGEEGDPMIFGKPGESSFTPQPPKPNTVQECSGLGMGFTLFDLDLFRDERLARPWFRTFQAYSPEYGPWQSTQDLYFFKKIHRLGYRVACDTRVKVGHYDAHTGIVW